MEEIVRRLNELREPTLRNLVHAVDIVLVAYLVYRLLALIRGPRAWRIVFGILFFLVALFLSDVLQLRTLHWVLDKAAMLLPVALVILLLPEFRQAVEGFGRFGLLSDRLPGSDQVTPTHSIEEIIAAVSEMAQARIGAIIVMERGAPMDDVASSGVMVHASVSAPLLLSVFFNGNPLHDGAVLVRNDKMVAAACRLPLSDSPRVDAHLHMRHRAAIGITEVADCIAIVVSEERGSISVAVDGRIQVIPGPIELRETLNALFWGSRKAPKEPRRRRRRVLVESRREP